jgi:hypothetical protein
MAAVTANLSSEFGEFLAHRRVKGAALLGVPAAISAAGGGIASAVEGFKRAQGQSLKGKMLSYLQCGRGVLNSVGAGICLVPASALNLALFFTTSKTVLFAVGCLTEVGEGLLGLSMLLYAFSALILIVHSLVFRYRLSQLKGEEEKSAFLQQTSDETLIYALGYDGMEAARAGEIDKIARANTKHILISLLYLAIGVAAAALSLVFELSGANLLLGVICLAMDAAALALEFKKGEEGKADRLWLALSFAVCAAVFAASAFFLPVIVPVILTIVLLLLHGAYRYSKNDGAANISHLPESGKGAGQEHAAGL